MEPGRLWERQVARASLVEPLWRLAGGRPGARVADVGCGSGYFALRYAHLTGPTGHVHAVDVDPAALAFLQARLDPAHHAHVTMEALDVTRAPLPELHFHALFSTAMLHHVEDVDAALRNLRASRAPLVVAEFDPAGPGEVGPPMEMRLAPDALKDALRRAGWRPRETRALEHESYALVSDP